MTTVRRPSRRQANAAGAAACALMMAFALFVQHVLGFEPCNLCLLQRGALILVGLLFLLAALHDPGHGGARVYAVLIGVAASLGAIVAPPAAMLAELADDREGEVVVDPALLPRVRRVEWRPD